MCNTGIDKRQEVLNRINDKIGQTELIALKIKAINFVNLQTFDGTYDSYDVGEVYKINGVGYIVITSKNSEKITFVVIMRVNNTWDKHWVDAHRTLEIKQGIYCDLFTGRKYKDNIKVKAFEPTYFKAIGEEDLIIKGEIYKN
tara:strand:- start:35 stop:463 length:429 start_codon:yes stop_codon:yes gene_type:complete